MTRRGLLGAAPLAAVAGAGAGGYTAGQGCAPVTPAVSVYPDDPRYQELTVGYNQRWVGSPDYVRLVSSTDQVVRAVQEAVDRGKRLSVVSGGHCLAPFVFNSDVDVVIDLSGLNGVAFDPRRQAFAVEGGARLANVYETLFKKWGVTVPGGMCPTVGIGGHTTGGGYGFLSRQFGAVIDHLEAVEVVVVDRSGTARAVVAGRDPADPHHDLWWASAGGGGGNFGVVTRFWFRTPGTSGTDPGRLLVRPPKDVLLSAVGIPWSALDEAKFTRLVANWGAWYEQHAAPTSPARVLSGVASLAHRSAQNVFLLTQVDATAPGARPKNFPVDVALVADPKATLAALAERLGPGRPVERRAAEPYGDTMMDLFAAELARRAPEGLVVFDEALTSSPALVRHLPPRLPGSYFLTRGGSLGVGIPGAIGIKLARPEAEVVAFTGDGGSMYTIQALWTAVRYGVAARFVICDNRRYQLLDDNLEQYWRERGVASHPHPEGFDLSHPEIDFVRLAKGLGVPAVKVAKPAQVEPAVARMLAEPGPFLVDLVTT
ncbi:thiamine pyrophosphate-dependent enzyme [Nonomuraea sp. NPDC003804]|uniref:thiamine pyrophosphate-dependent enzyme n=1 Tax=Nonomuraea sp. NPDC003804 TaxID=3154547 RepID=UPI00339F1550